MSQLQISLHPEILLRNVFENGYTTKETLSGIINISGYSYPIVTLQ